MRPNDDMSRRFGTAIAAVVAVFATCQAIAADIDTGAASSRCQTGPVEKTFGDNRWLVYSCDDNRSVAVVTAPGNPAAPFKYSLTAKTNGHQLDGEGTGNEAAARAAYNDLKQLSKQEIESLVAQT